MLEPRRVDPEPLPSCFVADLRMAPFTATSSRTTAALNGENGEERKKTAKYKPQSAKPDRTIAPAPTQERHDLIRALAGSRRSTRIVTSFPAGNNQNGPMT